MFWSLVVRDNLKDISKTEKSLLGFTVSDDLQGEEKEKERERERVIIKLMYVLILLYIRAD